MQFQLEDEAATHAFGQLLARHLLPGDVVTLSGPLGAGKSTLVRGVLRGLGVTELYLPSPTYTLVQTYDLPNLPLAHVDAYRITDAAELFYLGLEEALQRGVLLVEWPPVGAQLWAASPAQLALTLSIPPHLAARDGGADSATHSVASVGRVVSLQAQGSWQQRLAQLHG